MVVKPAVAFERLFQVSTGHMTTRRQDVTDTAFKAFHQSYGLRVLRSDQAVLHVVLCTCLVKRMLFGGLALSPRGEAIREALAMVRQHLSDLKRGLLNDSMKKRLSIACRLTRAHFQIDPARSTQATYR